MKGSGGRGGPKNNYTESINHKEERAKEWEGLSSEHDK